jgi:hypothetical protein
MTPRFGAKQVPVPDGETKGICAVVGLLASEERSV